MIKSFILAANIVLTPYYNVAGERVLGQIDELPDVCSFSFGRGTVLTVGTKLTVNPYTQHYGPWHVVAPEDGMTCGPCVVYLLTMVGTGVMTLHCEALLK